MCRKLAEARKLIMKGCELCPTSEDVWLEAARFQTQDNAKALLARGVAANPTSVKLWMQVMPPCSWITSLASFYVLWAGHLRVPCTVIHIIIPSSLLISS